MSNHSDQEYREWDETFRAVIALYVVLKTDYWSRLGLRKDIQKSHLDFLCDVEMRAWQSYHNEGIDPAHYVEFEHIFLRPEEYIEPEQVHRWVMGEAFSKANLGVSGPYRGLYWKIKNEQDRALMRTREAEDEPGDGNAGADVQFDEAGTITD